MFDPVIPLSLYIHFPWCLHKCPYCDFNSHPVPPGGAVEVDYLDALERDLAFSLPAVTGREIGSVFLGGGTPSLLSPGGVDRLLGLLRAHLSLHPDAEITLEANPGAADAAAFQGYRRAGVTRLSIGVQSFDDQMLRAIGRVHGAVEAAHAVERARDAGFDNINLDLMYALPGQGVAQALADLQRAVDLEPEHISWYQLTIEPGTRFFHRPPPLPDDDTAWAIQAEGSGLLTGPGYRQYEISAWAAPGRECRHNLNYWHFGDYLGLGPGAHGKFTNATDGTVTRTARRRAPAAYQQHAGSAAVLEHCTRLETGDLVLEFMMNALRLTGGIDPTLFTGRTGIPHGVIAGRLHQAQSAGLLEPGPERLAATPRGLRYLNDLLQIFMD